MRRTKSRRFREGATPPWRDVRLSPWPRGSEEWFALWLSAMPHGGIRTLGESRELRDIAARWLQPLATRRWSGRAWVPRATHAIRELVPERADFGQGSLLEWNRQYARLAIRSERSKGSGAARVVGVCIATDDTTGTRPGCVLARLDALAPAHLSFHAVVVTGTPEVEGALRGIAAGLCGAVRSVEVVRDPRAFRFARRVNAGARWLLERCPSIDSILLANDDTAPTALACARMAEWPTQNCLVGAVANLGGGGMQDVTGFWDRPGSPDATALVEAPHRLGGFFLYATVDVWRALEGFDEDFAGYGCDDTDFSIRAHFRGVRLLVDPIAFVWHRAGATFRQQGFEHLLPEALETFRRKHPNLPPYTVPFPLARET